MKRGESDFGERAREWVFRGKGGREWEGIEGGREWEGAGKSFVR